MAESTARTRPPIPGPDVYGARPRSVTLAAVLTLAAAVTGLVQAVNASLERRILADGIIKASKYMDKDQALYVTGGLRGSLDLALPAGVAILVIGLVLTYPLLRGRRWARTLLWLTGGLLIMTELVLTGADSSVNIGNYVRATDVPGGDPAVVAMINHMLLPAWFLPLHYLTEFITFACLIVACVQVALPTSAEYFQSANDLGGDHTRLWSVAKVRRQSPAD